ncbi:hypothetical protein CB1_001428023 [Camelus ferus]|nr:hypothetical protein CB1_001428023 [Camelus ferus]
MRLNVLNGLANNMDDLKINTDISGAAVNGPPTTESYVAHAKNPAHSIKKLPTSASVGCDIQNSVGSSIKSGSTLINQVEVDEDSDDVLVKDDCVSALTGTCSDTVDKAPAHSKDRFSDSNYTCGEDSSPVHTSTFLANTLKKKCEESDSESPAAFSTEEPSFYPCTKPYACRECGRTFRDRNSLLKHMIIHQERRQKLMEEIRELKELQDEGRSARLQCPQCVFGTNCPKTFVQHAKTHEKDKSPLGLDKRKSDILEEPIDIDSPKPLAKQQIQKARKSIAQPGVGVGAQRNSTPEAVTAKSSADQKPKYFHPASKDKSNAKANSNYLYRHKYENYRMIKKSDPHNSDTKRPESFKDHRRVAVKRKLNSAEKKDSYETEDESSWDNVELGDYATQTVEDDSYSGINQEHVNLFPLFKSKVEGREPGESVGLSNHVRGHLHRAGLSYEARHVVSPEQIATSDKMQHFKRTGTGTPVKRVRKAIEKSEATSEHTCQLCGEKYEKILKALNSLSASEEEGLSFLNEYDETKPELPSGRKNSPLMYQPQKMDFAMHSEQRWLPSAFFQLLFTSGFAPPRVFLQLTSHGTLPNRLFACFRSCQRRHWPEACGKAAKARMQLRGPSRGDQVSEENRTCGSLNLLGTLGPADSQSPADRVVLLSNVLIPSKTNYYKNYGILI